MKSSTLARHSDPKRKISGPGLDQRSGLAVVMVHLKGNNNGVVSDLKGSERKRTGKGACSPVDCVAGTPTWIEIPLSIYVAGLHRSRHFLSARSASPCRPCPGCHAPSSCPGLRPQPPDFRNVAFSFGVPPKYFGCIPCWLFFRLRSAGQNPQRRRAACVPVTPSGLPKEWTEGRKCFLSGVSIFHATRSAWLSEWA